jgi:hypothetical protein
VFASTGFHSWEARRTFFLQNIENPDGFHHFIECHLTKVFSFIVFASTGFHSWEARRTLFLLNIENQ